MTRRAQENVVLVIVLAALVAIVVMSLGYGPRARMVPLPMAGLGIALVLAQLVWQNVRPAEELQVDVFELLTGRAEDTAPATAGAAGEPGSRPDDRDAGRREALGIGLVLLLLALTLVIGPLPASFVFGIIYFRWVSGFTLLRALLYTLAVTGGIYLLFGLILGVQLDRTITGYGLGWMLFRL